MLTASHTERPRQEAQPHELLLSPLTVFLLAPAQPQAPFLLPPPAWDPQTQDLDLAFLIRSPSISLLGTPHG